MKQLLNVSNLKVNYGGVYAVKKISIQVYEGQIVSITGANGAGKSLGRFLLGKFIPENILNIFPMLSDRLDTNASSLSGGQAQMLALARGLMAKPLLLLLDEPTLGLAPIMVKEVLNLLSILRQQGLTILVVEQNVRQTLEISDYAYVLESGRMVMEGRGTELLNDSRLVKSYIGFGKS